MSGASVDGTFVAMLRALVLVALTVALASCGAGGAGTPDTGDGPTAEETRRVVVETAEDALPLAARSISGTAIQAEAAWEECMQDLSWRYAGGAVITAPQGTVAQQLEAIRAALVEAGYSDITANDGHVSVERDGVSVDVRQPAVGRDPRTWTASFFSGCSPYSDDDVAAIESDGGHDFPGIAP